MSISKDIIYKHFFEPVPLDFTFEERLQCKLIGSVEELKEVLSKAEGNIMSYDSETDGLDYNRHQICGFSFSFNSISGYYVPLRHEKYEIIETKVPKFDASGNVMLSKKDNQPLMKKQKVKEFTPYDCNLDPKECFDLLYRALIKAKLVLMHNSIFDMMMFKKEGYDTSKIRIFDTMCLTYNMDTNATGFFGLKPASELFLGRKAIKFKEVLGKEKTFKYTNPDDCLRYTVMDSANTFGLFNKLYPILKKESCESILNLDNKLVKSFLDYYTEAPLYIDKVIMNKYREEILKRREELELSIYNAVGYPFNIRSKDQLGKALNSMGIFTGVKTEKGVMSVSKDALNNVVDEHPIVKEIISLNSLEKQLNSYIDKLAEAQSLPDNDNIGICRINYKLFGTASGRLASGNSVKSKGDENDYFINLNIQNLTKPKSATYEAVKLDDDNAGVLGWDFILRDKKYVEENPNGYYVEGQSPEINVRRAIRTRDDSELILHLDYNAEEVKLAGVLSGEPNFIEPFKQGKDVHTEMAKKLFGEANYNKDKRKAAKVGTFGMLYGASPKVLQVTAKQQGVELTDMEAEDLYRRWWKANGIFKSWKDFKLDEATCNKFTVKDMFGRPRRVKHYLTSEEKGIYNFGVRTIASHLIQGSASSVMRMMMVKLANSIFLHPRYGQEVSYVSAVHDEINFRIKKKNILSWIKVIEKAMTYQPANFPIPLDCGLEVGTSLGCLFEFEWNSEKTKLIPKRA